MKKLISIFIILVMCMSLTACEYAEIDTSEEEVSAEPTAAPEPTPEVSEEEEESSTESSSASTHGEDSSLPTVSGSDKFISAFTGNDIDLTYLEDLSLAATVTAMTSAATTATTSWEREINYAYTELMNIIEDTDDKTQAELENSAWLNELSIVIVEIQDEYNDDASMNKFYIAYEVMLVYRERAAEIYSDIYDISSDLEFAPEEDVVVG